MNTNIFKKLNLKPSFSSGVIEKTVFVSPCILLEIVKRPIVKHKNQGQTSIIKKLISDFNKQRKNKKNITLLVFRHGTMRIVSGSQSMSVFKKRGKMKLSDKKIMLRGMIKELEVFTDFAKGEIR